MAVSRGLPLDRRSGFDDERDLYRYAQRLSAAVDGGDAEAGWMLSRVYDYCAAYAQDPAGYAADSTALAGQALPGASAMFQARQRLQARCTGFVARDALTASRILAQRTDAARAGNLAAEAALLSLGRPLQATAEYRRELVQRVLDSRDPEAYLALSGAMGATASGDDAYRGYVAGDQYAQLAWQLAACRLGLDCDAGSNLMTSYCANGGICSSDASQDFPSFVIRRRGTAAECRQDGRNGEHLGQWYGSELVNYRRFLIGARFWFWVVAFVAYFGCRGRHRLDRYRRWSLPEAVASPADFGQIRRAGATRGRSAGSRALSCAERHAVHHAAARRHFPDCLGPMVPPKR